MSNNHTSNHLSETLNQEVRYLKSDLWHLLIVNALLLAGLLTLYYTNQSSGWLNRWFESVI